MWWLDPAALLRALAGELVGGVVELLGAWVAVLLGPAARAWLQVAGDLVIARCRRTVNELRDTAAP